MAIWSFRDQDTRAFYEGKRVKRFQSFRAQAERRLQMLDSATALADLAAIPGNRLERLRGDRQGQYSIRINDQWRICFKWENEWPSDVEIVDYH
ncbi:MAG TPA: type II toxin-antitoxin system RelE/ParE family toxin [Stellaceae bacterium]|nr:type II toxin-antitoxin system RelE/ParE family toxin [Stellaceae bacterium]